MPNYLHRTTLAHLKSVASADLPEALANYIEYPDLSAVEGQLKKYWVITGDVVSLMDQAAKDAVDAQLLSDMRDAIADEIDQVEDRLRSQTLAVLDELNAHALKINAILDAIDGASNLNDVKTAVAAISDYPQRSIAQVKTTIRNKLGS